MNVPEKRTFILENLREHCKTNGKRYISERLGTSLTDINQRANGDECDRLAGLMLEDGIIAKIPWQPEGDEIEAPFLCQGCGRPEEECSADPCADVIAQREVMDGDDDIPNEITDGKLTDVDDGEVRIEAGSIDAKPASRQLSDPVEYSHEDEEPDIYDAVSDFKKRKEKERAESAEIRSSIRETLIDVRDVFSESGRDIIIIVIQ